MYTKTQFSRYFLLCLSLSSTGTVNATVSANAETVYLKQDCTGIQNCFSAVTDLVTWMDTQRFPDAGSPLLVNIGPGRFKGPFQCINHTHITLQGSGRSNTIIYGDKSFIPGNVLFAPGMNLRNCDHLNVTDLQVEGEYGAVWWGGSGETNWVDVDLEAGGRGWYEFGNCDPDKTMHSWFNSRIISTPYVTSSVAYSSFCGKAMFHHTELSAYATSTGTNGLGWGDLRALWVQGGTANVYGGMLRTVATLPPMSGLAALESVRVKNGTANLMNTAIEIDSSIDHPVSVLRSETGGAILAFSSAFLIPDITQQVTRIDLAGGSINASFHWGARTEPPNVTSVTGADRYTEIDCSTSGCQTQGITPHEMIYNQDCSISGPWFDTVTTRCRGL